MTLEDSAMALTMVVVFVSSMDLVVSSNMLLNRTTIMVSSMDLAKILGLIIGTKLCVK
ncbi:MAG: hypothetical protein H6Q68_3783 [Firmicutes bacterium]|nr:hypothetical protein [Bacillota bacterium]